MRAKGDVSNLNIKIIITVIDLELWINLVLNINETFSKYIPYHMTCGNGVVTWS